MADYNKPKLYQPYILTFGFDVGTTERHRVEFRFNQDIGNLRITVDGRPVIRRFEMLSFSTTRNYEFTVGEVEKHSVLIEKTRERLLGGARPQKVVVYVDGEMQGRYGQSW